MNKKTSRKRPQQQKNRYEGKMLSTRSMRQGAMPRAPRYNRAVEGRWGGVIE